VLEEGLDHSADGIQREKVVQMVSQALTQFKGCKEILESTKMQTPQLYQASIAMLRAMIEMASLLGLGEGNGNAAPVQTESTLGQEQAALTPPPEEQNDEWHDPFPTHPDQGGEQKPGHAPPKAKPRGAPPAKAKGGFGSPQP
jgi:hypothetical protein